ncbi:MAG TPA: hypothetical protein VH414_15005 [Lichenihabitans sp.]|nr:hypothetical protein [Lichenihabitans sp.]
MPRRKTAVTLSRAAGSRRDVPRPGFEDATPERLVEARRHGSARIDAAGVRRLADPFDTLRARNLLDRVDIAANEALWHAGDRLRAHWHGAHFDGLSAFDISRPMVDGGAGRAPSALNPSEIAQRHREHFLRAQAAVGPRLMPYAQRVVIDGEPVSALRALVGDTSHVRTAEALALERLREGLHRLCDLWGMRPQARPLPIRHWRDAAAAPE